MTGIDGRADAACACGRRFAKPFGLRVHQRTCTLARTGVDRAAEAEIRPGSREVPADLARDGEDPIDAAEYREDELFEARMAAWDEETGLAYWESPAGQAELAAARNATPTPGA